MKRKQWLILGIMILTIFYGLGVFAQAAVTGEDLSVFDSLYVTLSGFIASIPVVVELIKKLLTEKGIKLKGIWIQVISWGTGVVLSFACWYFNLGMFEPIAWWHALLIGIGGSLAANGVADTGIIEFVLDLVKSIRKLRKTTTTTTPTTKNPTTT